MTPIQLELMAALAERSTLTESARAVGLSQPAASRALSSLERELGVKICARTSAGLELTPIGLRLVRHANTAVNAMASMRIEANNLGGGVSGKLRIGAFSTAMSSLIAPIVARLQTDNPQLEIVLLEGTDAEIVDWLDRNAVDAGSIVGYPNPAEGMLLAEDDYVVITSTSHRLAAASSITPEQLACEPLIRSTGGCGPDTDRFLALAPTTPTIRFNIADTGTILAMAREDLGVAYVPRLAVPSSADGLAVLTPNPPQPRPIALAYSDALNPATIALQQAAAAHVEILSRQKESHAT